ncbi:MAG: J domain-containing protein [Deltaproteobacteria bacterium]|nr:J domain-containing protein [Deltaproteobacteria bacterium]
MKQNGFLDYYESLQVSPNADQETIERVFRFLAKRYHPDSGSSGDVERFSMLVEAYSVLSDSEKRAAYDATYDRVRAVQAQIRKESYVLGDLSGDEALRHGILSTLYIARRRDARDCGVGAIHLEQVLECPQYQMDFHLWYLREKGWVERTETGMFAITVAGVDEVEKKRLIVKKELLLTAPRPEGLEQP